MTSPEGQIPPSSAFLSLDEFTPEMLLEIAGIYQQTVGGNVDFWIYPGREMGAHNEVVEMWDKYGPDSAEYRLGSSLSIHSKLWLIKQRSDGGERVEVTFEGNLGLRASESEKAQARELRVNFAQKVQESIDSFREKE